MSEHLYDDALDGAETTDWSYRRNALGFSADMALFEAAFNLIGFTTVLPAFLAALVDSEILIGLATGMASAAWLLPQIAIAGQVAQAPRKKPLVMRAVWIARPVVLLMALLVWLLGVRIPWLTFAVVTLCVIALFVGDAFSSVAWFDLIAKVLPLERRGRILGLGQMVGGLLGVAAGIVVSYILGPESPWAFPNNYALVFAVSGIIFLLGGLALSLIQEPEIEAPTATPQPVSAVLASIPSILEDDPDFRRVVIVRLLVNLMGGAGAFYVLYATLRLGFEAADVGLFISAQVLGSTASGGLLSLAQDRWGPVTHLRIIILLSIFPPLLALLAAPVQAVLPGATPILFVAVFFFLGLYSAGFSWPFYNWILEYCTSPYRPLYIGLINTMSAVTMVSPAIAGWIVGSVSYRAVFAIAVGLGVVAFILSKTIPSTRVQPTIDL